MLIKNSFVFRLLQAPVNYVCLHCVKPSLRPLSMAVSTVAIHIFGDVPSSPLVGIVQVKKSLLFISNPGKNTHSFLGTKNASIVVYAGLYRQLEKNRTDLNIDSVLSCCNMVYW